MIPTDKFATIFGKSDEIISNLGKLASYILNTHEEGNIANDRPTTKPTKENMKSGKGKQ